VGHSESPEGYSDQCGSKLLCAAVLVDLKGSGSDDGAIQQVHPTPVTNDCHTWQCRIAALRQRLNNVTYFTATKDCRHADCNDSCYSGCMQTCWHAGGRWDLTVHACSAVISLPGGSLAGSPDALADPSWKRQIQRVPVREYVRNAVRTFSTQYAPLAGPVRGDSTLLSSRLLLLLLPSCCKCCWPIKLIACLETF
jgi:hypothetical protein